MFNSRGEGRLKMALIALTISVHYHEPPYELKSTSISFWFTNYDARIPNSPLLLLSWLSSEYGRMAMFPWKQYINIRGNSLYS